MVRDAPYLQRLRCCVSLINGSSLKNDDLGSDGCMVKITNRSVTATTFPVLASVLSPDALATEICRAYAIGDSAACTLLRAYVNDVYALNTPSAKYIIKVYRANWRTESEILYELDLLFHLHRSGVGVSLPMAKKDGRLLHSVLAPEGQRLVVLYQCAEGDKPRPPFSDEL